VKNKNHQKLRGGNMMTF